MKDHNYYVYILASRENGTLYIGVTNNLIKRVWQHKEGVADSFTKKYGVDKLVFYEHHTDINGAIAREKAMKKWNRKWKLRRINEFNPEWNDLYDSLA